MVQRMIFCLCTFLFIVTTLNAQVNLQTGSATFSIPMFNWQDTKSRLNTSVALSYNSGNGVKVDEVASNVGQGWNLLAGGVITRLQVGEPDDQDAYEPGGADGPEREIRKFPAGYLYAPVEAGKGCSPALTRYPIYGGKNQVYKQHNHVTADKQLDYFAFQFNGKTGMFILRRDATEGIPLGDTKMKISFEHNLNASAQGIRTTINRFTIRDVDGLIYRFDVPGLTKVLEANYCDATATRKLTQPEMKPGRIYNQAGFENSSFMFPWVVGSWYLREIEDAFTGRKITFNYVTRQVNNKAGADISYDSWHDYVIITNKTSITRTPELTSITTPDNHLVTFNYGKDRADLAGEKVLSTVDITYAGRYLSKYQLNTTYFIQNRYGQPVSSFQQKMARLCLRSVKKLGVDLKEDSPPYIFDYYTGSNAPDDIVPPPFTTNHDIWGMYNGNFSVGFSNEEQISPTAGVSTLNFNQLRGLCFQKNGVNGMHFNTKDGYAKNGLLRQIIYPTGGTLTYEYEQNRGTFIGASAEMPVGGVHVSRTNSTDGGYSNGCANPIVTSYAYVMNGAGSASSMWGLEMPVNSFASSMYYHPEYKYYTWKWSCLAGCCDYKFKYPGILSLNQAVSLTDFQRFMTTMAPVFGILSVVSTVMNVVTVVCGPTGVLTWVALIVDVIGALVQIVISCFSNQTKQGTSIVFYSYNMNGVSPLPTQFKRVEVVEGAGTSGKTVQTFTSDDDYPIWEPTNPNFSARQRFAPWAYGLPKKSTVYNASGNKVKETENQYSFTYSKDLVNRLDIHLSTPAHGIRSNLVSCKCLVKRSSSQRNTDWADPAKYKNLSVYQLSSTNDLAVEFCGYYTGSSPLVGTYDRDYNPANNSQYVESVTTYTYNQGSPNFEVNSIRTNQSNGDDTYKYIQYSGNFTGGVFDVLNSKNVVSLPVVTTQTISRSGTTSALHQTVTELTQLGNGDIKPLRILEIRSDRPIAEPWNSPNWTEYSGPNTTDYSKYKVTQQFTYNSAGNLTGAKDEGNRAVSNIYDYDDKFIVASVINADAVADKAAYTSFESPYFGGWNVTGNPSAHVANSGVTGVRAYNLSGNTLSASLNAAKPYRVSFWASAALTVTNGGTPVTSAPTINGFTYYEYSIPAGTSTVSISGNAQIDELRVYPKMARMRTVTYDPLIGKTSDCDENNRITYYEYDNLGRLQFIKDEARNITKMYEYNNVSVQNGCPGVYYNRMITEYFTKSNCGSGYVGLEVPFVVAANKYSSSISQEDADAKAEAELLADGQNNANNAGSQYCRQIFYNTAQSQSFTTETCAMGWRGGTVTYTVPANTYSSFVSVADANLLANEEIKANGQAYANEPANAVCTPDNTPYWEWEESGEKYCANINGQLPAHTFVLAIDKNPNSPSYNTTQWKDIGVTTDCDPNLYYSTSQSGDYYSQICSGGNIALPYPVYMPPGSYTSTSSVADANAQAVAAAQQEADWYGQCQPQMVDLEYQNAGQDEVDIEFYNPSTNEYYYFTAPYWSSGDLGQVPAGTYNITFIPWLYRYHDFVAGCDGQDDGWDYITLYNVVINPDCNQLFMNTP